MKVLINSLLRKFKTRIYLFREDAGFNNLPQEKNDYYISKDKANFYQNMFWWATCFLKLMKYIEKTRCLDSEGAATYLG